jgi:zinc/manganese transport system substrate-binding protein
MRPSGISRWLTVFCVFFAWCGHGGLAAQPPVRVLVSFSILEDIVREIGGADVAVTSLIGPDSDAHVFEPSPDQLRLLAQAQLFVVNGLGLEGWETRLVQSAQYHGPVVVGSHGITPIETAEPGAGAPVPDPHAWQDVKNAEIYATNIAQALQGADPERADDYRRGLDRYRAELETLDREVRTELAGIPPAKRRVITTHDAFAYYGQAYGVIFLAPEGLSTDSEPSAEGIARLTRQIRREDIKALFLENVSDPRLMEALAHEVGAKLGPPLFSDALSRGDEPASTYVKMIRYNTAALKEGMLKD